MSKKPKKRKHRRPSKQARRDKTAKPKEAPRPFGFEPIGEPWTPRGVPLFFDFKTLRKEQVVVLFDVQEKERLFRSGNLNQSTTSPTAQHELYRLVTGKQ